MPGTVFEAPGVGGGAGIGYTRGGGYVCMMDADGEEWSEGIGELAVEVIPCVEETIGHSRGRTKGKGPGFTLLLAALVASTLWAAAAPVPGALAFIGARGFATMMQSSQVPAFRCSLPSMVVDCTPETIIISGSRALGASSSCAGHVKLTFANARPDRRIWASEPNRTLINTYIGREPAGWLGQTESFRQLKYTGLWPGLVLILRVEADQLLCFTEAVDGSRVDLHLWDSPDQAGLAAPGLIVTERCASVQVTLDEDGVVIAPVSAPPSKRLGPIGEKLVWSTLLGSNGDTDVRGSAVCENGDVMLCGYTWNDQFADTSAIYDGRWNEGGDAYVCRLAADGSRIVWATIIGSPGMDEGRDLILDSQGNVVLVAWTSSADYPVSPGALDYGGNLGGYVAATKLDGDSGILVWSALVGPASARAVGRLSDDRYVIVGNVIDASYPITAGALRATYGGRGDGFLTIISPDGSQILASTFFGGTENDSVEDVAVDEAGAILVCGNTNSGDSGRSGFPATPDAFDPSPNGGHDAFVAKVSGQLDAVVWCSFLGGSGDDWATSLRLNGTGDVAVLVQMYGSPEYPLSPDALPCLTCARYDAAVTMLDSGGTSLLMSTRVGGDHFDFPRDLDLDASGNIYMLVETASDGLPVASTALQAYRSGDYDMYVMVLDPAGGRMLWGSYFGGGAWEGGAGIHSLPSGGAIVLGESLSPDALTTPGAFDRTPSGGICVQVARLGPLHVGVQLSELGAERRSGDEDVELTWLLSGASEDCRLSIWRAEPGRRQSLIAAGIPAGGGRGLYIDSDAPSVGLEYTLEIADGGTQFWYGPVAVGGLPELHDRLGAAYPNPFNPSVTVPFALARAGSLDIAIFDLRGRRVRTLLNGWKAAGRYEVMWDGLNQRGAALSSGPYLCVMRTASGRESVKLSLMR